MKVNRRERYFCSVCGAQGVNARGCPGNRQEHEARRRPKLERPSQARAWRPGDATRRGQDDKVPGLGSFTPPSSDQETHGADCGSYDLGEPCCDEQLKRELGDDEMIEEVVVIELCKVDRTIVKRTPHVLALERQVTELTGALRRAHDRIWELEHQ